MRLLIILLFLAGCGEPIDCNCGFIHEDRVQDHSILVENNCTGNYKWFYLSRGEWLNAYPGETICFDNVDEW